MAGIQKSLKFFEKKITPVWIFDGKPSDLKSDTNKKRETKRKNATKVLEEALLKGDHAAAMKAARQTICLKEGEVQLFKELLIAAGVPYATADTEADHKIAKLSKGKKIAGVLSEDSDLLSHGVDVLLRPKGAEAVEVYNREDILKELGLSQEQFVDLCILLGTDYNDNPVSLGPVTAFKLIQDCGCIEEIIKKNEKFDLTDIQMKYKSIRGIFDEINNIENEVIMTPTFEFEKLAKFLEKRGFKLENREKYLARFKKLVTV